MPRWNRHPVCRSLVGLLTWLLLTTGQLWSKPVPEPITLVILDPLARELACACVKGYGQRDYRKLADRLEKAIDQPVGIEFSDDLAETLQTLPASRQVIVVGDRSLVAHGARLAGLKCRPVSELTDLDGATTLTASFVVRSDDSVKDLKELNGRKIFIGLSEADEKQAAALKALRVAGVALPDPLNTRASFTDAALDMLDSSLSPPPAAVIPSYGLRLLEGCGSVRPGNLKVIGRTPPVPFITVFMAEAVPMATQQKVLKALLAIKSDKKLLKALESRDGFKALDPPDAGNPRTSAVDWPDWRGPRRDGHVPRLPSRLPTKVKYAWKKPAMSGALAGLSVSGKHLILAERDLGDANDVFRCLHANTGELLWRVEYPAPGTLDYGQSPRATPVIHEGRAYLLGAFGHLRCVDVTNGKLQWQRQLPREFQAELPTWGMCSTPLIVDDLLIVNPGATNASLAALDRATGQTRWTTPGLPAAYSAFICGEFGQRRQIVGYDQHSLGGWDVATGQRLWQLVPPTAGDFNVPTPIAFDDGLVVATENNGTRFYRFDASGRIIPKAAGQFADLSPDTTTPVAVGGRLFGVHAGLHCLDVKQGLKAIWHQDEPNLGDHSALIADGERVLVISLQGELILLDGREDKCNVISRLRVFDDDVEVYSHPALAGTRLYLRGGYKVVCVELGERSGKTWLPL